MHFVIAGKVNCSQFVYASMIAQRLKELLPEFTYTRIAKRSGEWEKWLLKTCKENEWYHSKSPIVWREISMTKGKKYLIGDVTKFLDLCQDHYGLTREMLTGEVLERTEMDWFTRRSEAEYISDVKTKAKRHLAYRCRQVCILGAGSQACDLLILELLHIPLQSRENGLEIRLYDDPKRSKKLEVYAQDAKYCLGYSGLGSCRVAKNIREALYNVDLVIVMDSFPRRPNESLVKWLKRNRNAMCLLGNALNKYAKPHCRVIIGSPSNQPICYNATVLASVATKLHVRNIVAVTQDLGREALSPLAKKTKLDLNNFYCPPVWGFVGLNKYVDLRNTLYNYYYKVPGPHISVHLPQGREELELRTADPLLREEDINEIFMSIARHKVESIPRLGRISQLAKITAILDLLRVWGLKQEDGNGEILSLGVYSDGTFNIPEGIYWSQPVTLVNGFWKPFADFPVPRNPGINLHNFFILGLASLSQTSVTMRIQRDSEPIKKPKRQPRKFDVESIRKKVKIPVIRTRSECLSYLKRLAAEELNISFEVKSRPSTIPEESLESTIESVPREKIYCECWREELLQLRKMAFDKSSTSEVEVDLSENLSGSEWSVVNPAEPYVPSSVSLEEKELQSTETSSGAVVCDCSGDCHCLDPPERESSYLTQSTASSPEISSVRFFRDTPPHVRLHDNEKEEVAQAPIKKELRFDSSLGPCDGQPKKKFKFYGTKDAIVDDERRAMMRKRIRMYDKEGKDDDEESGETDSLSFAESGEFEFFAKRFHVSVDGRFDIIGDPEGLEALEEMRRSGAKESTEDFAEMWEDEVTPALQVLSAGSESISLPESQSDYQVTPERRRHLAADERSEEELYGEGGELFLDDMSHKLEAIPEAEVEDELEGEQESFVQTAVEKVTEETSVKPERGTKEPEHVLKSESEVRRKREGIPRCCLCHCIVPEGELGCHCGETRVMEVFKKESVEMIPESEEEYAFRIEPESVKTASTASLQPVPEPPRTEPESEEEDVQEVLPPRKRRDIFSLPPESFLPFSPKPVNKFTVSERPPELRDTKQEGFLSPECLKVLEEVKERVMEEIKEEHEKKKSIPEGFLRDSLAISQELNFELREREILHKSYSPVFHPVEDWRTMLMRKYKEWFDSGSDFRDDFYYDMAVEEVSEDEYEVDKELSQYFED